MTLQRKAVSVFIVWHLTAITVASLPTDAPEKQSPATDGRTLPVVARALDAAAP